MEKYKDRLRHLLDETLITPYYLSNETGISEATLSRILNDVTERPNKNTNKILADYFNVSVGWLLTGKGKKNEDNLPNKNYNYKGAPYYDVDFIGGFDLVLEDNTVNPEYYIDLPPYNKPGIVWCNLYGKSMEPFIMSGDRIALKEIQVDDVIFGKAYGIITRAGLRTVKWVVRSPEKGNYRLVPENKDPKFGDYQDIEIKSIFKVFLILGAVRAF